jgi:hypothetical protein
MSLFVEVTSVDKSTKDRDVKVIINLDHVVEVAPLLEGGCTIFFNDSAAVNGVRTMKVKDSFAMFQQLVMTVITPNQMSERIAKIKEATVPKDKKPATEKTFELPNDFNIPKL